MNFISCSSLTYELMKKNWPQSKSIKNNSFDVYLESMRPIFIGVLFFLLFITFADFHQCRNQINKLKPIEHIRSKKKNLKQNHFEQKSRYFQSDKISNIQSQIRKENGVMEARSEMQSQIFNSMAMRIEARWQYTSHFMIMSTNIIEESKHNPQTVSINPCIYVTCRKWSKY